MTDDDRVRTAACRGFDTEFQAASGLTDRRLYKIQYSPLHRFSLLALGDNPGGLLKSLTFYEDGKHDIVEFREHLRYHNVGGHPAFISPSILIINLPIRSSQASNRPKVPSHG